MRGLLAISLAVATAATSVAAVTVSDCGDYRTSIQALAEPWEANTRTFANGAIRVAVADTIEPAVGAVHLVILHPPLDELGGPACHVISASDSFGFSAMDFDAIRADYDPARGLGVVVPVGVYNPTTAGFDETLLSVTINQSTGSLSARVD